MFDTVWVSGDLKVRNFVRDEILEEEVSQSNPRMTRGKRLTSVSGTGTGWGGGATPQGTPHLLLRPHLHEWLTPSKVNDDNRKIRNVVVTRCYICSKSRRTDHPVEFDNMISLLYRTHGNRTSVSIQIEELNHKHTCVSTYTRTHFHMLISLHNTSTFLIH